MHKMTIAVLAIFATVFLPALTAAQTPARSGTSPTNAPEPSIESGVYGFSGGKVPGADFKEGVVGECIWIFDQANRNQLAKGDCTERHPGRFRVVLKPGRYVVRGPGGNRPIELKAGQWLNIESVTLLPAGP